MKVDRSYAVEPPLRAAIAGYKASGGQRAYVVGEDLRTHLQREHRYSERQLSGLTQEELELLHGWIHADRETEARQRVQRQAPVQYQPRYFSAPSFGGSRGGC